MDDDVEVIRRVALRWTAAIEQGDVTTLHRLASEDIVVVHGDGRTLSGREVVIGDLARALESHSLRQSVEFDETIIAGDWAFDRARVHMSVTPRDTGATRELNSTTFTVLRRTASGEWSIARAIGVIHQQ